VGTNGVMQPATDVIAGAAAALQYFVMATATTQIACPAAIARLLLMDMPLFQPQDLAALVNTLVCHGTGLVADKAMAGR
jgi:hypothetical protein